MQLRPYRDRDATATRDVFEAAVHSTATADYTSEQVNAWAPLSVNAADLARWAQARAAARTIVAVEHGQVVGFSDLTDGTLVDMLYVDPRFGRRGIGSALLTEVVRLARTAGAGGLETDASLTARALFERHGFVVIRQQTPVVREVAMTNFKMRLNLARP